MQLGKYLINLMHDMTFFLMKEVQQYRTLAPKLGVKNSHDWIGDIEEGFCYCPVGLAEAFFTL